MWTELVFLRDVQSSCFRCRQPQGAKLGRSCAIPQSCVCLCVCVFVCVFAHFLSSNKCHQAHIQGWDALSRPTAANFLCNLQYCPQKISVLSSWRRPRRTKDARWDFWKWRHAVQCSIAYTGVAQSTPWDKPCIFVSLVLQIRISGNLVTIPFVLVLLQWLANIIQ
jgi:hypothetical protein